MRRLDRILYCLFLAAPLVGHAHSALESSTPRAGAVLGSPPKALKLHFSETLEPALIKIQVHSADASIPVTSSLSPDGKEVSVDLKLDARGVYRVDWSVVARDGHPTKGSFSFTIGKP